MTNQPTNYSAGLMLDEDFVKRAIAMRGGQNLDSAFLMDLLEAGLAIMELSAGNHDDRCADPDCPGCRIRRGEQPRASMVAEFNEVQAHLEQVAEAREAGESPDREVSFMVSETSLIFMTWLDRLLRQRASGGLRIVGSDIDLDRPVDMEGAMRFLTHMLIGTLEEEMAAFTEGRHPLLFPTRASARN
ncbi:hypothetical protein ASD50_19205 [Mesorhizobium sp. Root552]|jgi:hypothetical protein|uniref:hypothetical protein n=1 Tax=Mesorhizobium sp. Root552 TaxID=1736555 RepID=UPI0006FF5ACB|nr:hypothetical protein [Mesorhizobium sp. Root552]KQZ28619.1 hypothetical protein ASD50_19205 [Mesorhizobium sp. Root552]